MGDIETDQANRSLILSKKGDKFPVQPSSKSDVVPTFFWADNFDTIKEWVAGVGSVNATYLTVPRRKNRRFCYEDTKIDCKAFHKTKEPEKLVADIFILSIAYGHTCVNRTVSIRLLQFLKTGCSKSNP